MLPADRNARKIFDPHSEYPVQSPKRARSLSPSRSSHKRSSEAMEASGGESLKSARTAPNPEKPLYQKVLNVVLPVLDNLTSKGFLPADAHQKLGAPLVNPQLTEPESKVRCHEILKTLLPSAPACPYQDFPKAVEALIQQKIQQTVAEINTIDPAQVQNHPGGLFPLQSNPSKPSDPSVVLPAVLKFALNNPELCKDLTVDAALKNLIIRCVTSQTLYAEETSQVVVLIKTWNQLAELGLCPVWGLGAYFHKQLNGMIASQSTHEYTTLEIETFAFIAQQYPKGNPVSHVLQAGPSNASLPNPSAPKQSVPPSPFVAQLIAIYKNPKIPLSEKQHAETILHWINPKLIPTQMIIKFSDGSERKQSAIDVQTLKKSCLYFSRLFAHPDVNENKQKMIQLGGTGNPSDATFEQFIPSVAQWDQFIAVLLGKSSEFSFEAWLGLAKTADYFNLTDRARVFNLLKPTMVENEETLAEFLTSAAQTFTYCDPITQEFWQVYRDQLLSNLLEKPNREVILDTMVAYEQHADYQAPWMKITSLTIRRFLLASKVRDKLAKLKNLTSLTIQNVELAPNLEIMNHFPQLKKLDVLDIARERNPLFLAHANLEVLKKKFPVDKWRTEIKGFPRLKELHIIFPEPKPEQYFTEEDKKAYPNLSVYVNNVLVFKGEKVIKK